MYFNIGSSIDWTAVEPIPKGWSSDKKYLVRARSGERLLLRISDIDQFDNKKKEYEIIQKYSALGITMSQPKEFGVCNEDKNVYMLLSWLDGVDLESVLAELPEKEQYLLGRQAGTILRKIHSIELEKTDIPQTTKIPKKLSQLSRYEQSKVRISNDQNAIGFVKKNIDRIRQKGPVYLHGDFHPGNLIYMDNKEIGVIDFNRWEVGDPYEEFYKLDSFGVELSIPYCCGQIDAYFEDNIPEEFWKVNAIYVAHTSLFSITWAEQFGQEDVDGMVTRAKQAIENYNDFAEVIPKWYTNKYREKYMDDQP